MVRIGSGRGNAEDAFPRPFDFVEKLMRAASLAILDCTIVRTARTSRADAL
jgi:hypothetical protein